MAKNHLIITCHHFQVLGLDCEWVSQPSRGPVALLQLAVASGMIVMVRLFMMDDIPVELEELLADRR